MTREDLFLAIGQVESSCLSRSELSSLQTEEDKTMYAKPKRTMRNLLIAAVIVSMLAVTAYAAAGYLLFDRFYGGAAFGISSEGAVFEVYNGSGKLAWDSVENSDKRGYKHLRINKLMELDSLVKDEERIPQINGIRKMRKEFKNKK